MQYIKLLATCLSIVLGLAASAASQEYVSPSDQPAKGTLVGQFVEKEKMPLANGRVFIYDKAQGPPSSERQTKSVIGNRGRSSQ